MEKTNEDLPLDFDVVVNADFIRTQCPDQFTAFMTEVEQLTPYAEYNEIIWDLTGLYGVEPYNSEEGLTDNTLAKLDKLYQNLQKAFENKTGLSLLVRSEAHYSATPTLIDNVLGKNVTYSEEGVFWCVKGVYTLTKEAIGLEAEILPTVFVHLEV